MFYFAAILIGITACLPALMWARHQNDDDLRTLAGWGLILVAVIYVIFAMEKGDGFWKITELLGVVFFGCFYWFSKKKPLKMLAIGWLLHPIWDVFLHLLGAGSYLVPEWYATACVAFDLIIAAYLFWRHHQQASLPPELKIVH